MATAKSSSPRSTDFPAKAARIATWLEEKQAKEIVALDVSRVCSITEALIIVTATSARHAKALADHVHEKLAESGDEYLGMEGYSSGQWILMDANDVIVHIFLEDQRSFFNLEGMWSEGEPIPMDAGAGA